MDQEMLDKIEQMRVQRGWDKTDTPAILAKSVVVEAAELLECFQFSETKVDYEAVKSEVADVLMYAISLCVDQGWDYKQVVIDKIKDVESRYPRVQ